MRLLLVAVLLSFSSVALAQAQWHFALQVIPVDEDTSLLRQQVSYRNNFPDTLTRRREVIKMLKSIYDKGYLFATIDSVAKDSLHERVFLKVGKPVKWAYLKNGNVPGVLLEKVNFKDKLFSGKVFKAADVHNMEESVLTYCENNGFPFARVWLDSVKWHNDSISAKLYLQKNRLILIDSIRIVGNLKISRSYLYNYIGVKPNTPYNEDAIRKINNRLQELAFLEVEKPPSVIFNDNKATINLYLRAKNASNFDLVLGVLPNNATTGKLVLTGDGTLGLNNALGKGETIGMQLNKYPNNITNFKANLAYPFLFSLPFGVTGDFELYKNDTLYLNLKEELGVEYLMKGQNYIKAFVQNTSSSLLSIDTTSIKLDHQLPSSLDMSNTSYGLEMYLEKLDYRLNPRRGYTIKLTAAIGERVIKKNDLITNLHDPNDSSFNFNTLYDTIKLKVTEYKFDVAVQTFFPIKRREVIKLGFQGGMLVGDDLLPNELYLIGGNNDLRGFDEESIAASWYNIFTIEFRYLMGKNSFFYLFSDGGYWQNQAAIGTAPRQDTPYGFGAGLNFETKAGIFGINYALGKQLDNPIQLREAKIHFGYVNRF